MSRAKTPKLPWTVETTDAHVACALLGCVLREPEAFRIVLARFAGVLEGNLRTDKGFPDLTPDQVREQVIALVGRIDPKYLDFCQRLAANDRDMRKMFQGEPA